MHLGALAAAFLLVVAWKFRLERYGLRARPAPSRRRLVRGRRLRRRPCPRRPGSRCCRSSPASSRRSRAVVAPRIAALGGWIGAIPAGGVSSSSLVSFGSWLPALVQRFAVDPNPLLSEQPVHRAIDRRDAERPRARRDRGPAVSPTGHAERRRRLARSRRSSRASRSGTRACSRRRMRDLVTETPYFRPERPTVDIVRVDGQRQLTVASARELDLGRAGGAGRVLDQRPALAYTHGLGLPRFSATDITGGRPAAIGWTRASQRPAAHLLRRPAQRPRRAGSSWTRAAPRSTRPRSGRRLPLHGRRRDPRCRAGSSAPCSRSRSAARSCSSRTTSRAGRGSSCTATCATGWRRWRRSSSGIAHPSPVDAGGRIVFVVDGYTTSASYPYAAARRARSGNGQLRPRFGARDRRRVLRPRGAVSGRRPGPDRASVGRGVPVAVPPAGSDARAGFAIGLATRSTSSTRSRPPTSGSTPLARTCSRAVPTSGRRRRASPARSRSPATSASTSPTRTTSAGH